MATKGAVFFECENGPYILLVGAVKKNSWYWRHTIKLFLCGELLVKLIDQLITEINL